MRIVSVSDGGRKMAYESEPEPEPNNKKLWTVRESDPMVVLGVDLMLKVYESLDARSLASSLLVSRSWFSVASLDTLWSPLCTQLWVGKAHIPRWSKLSGLSKLTSYSRAVIDSKRIHITREDLWDHAWIFHFTEATILPC
ncbi:uncharacterized protein LOC141602547 [Silene latifolia]|uniref:uncharacterized protein LOC141602547 n=1 Tax=Silene latifolia TaxID=37657 RepID=UPI003D7727F1